MTDINKELFKQPNTEFTQHLNIPFNERIIFSARFGMGKTTFLKWYFQQSAIKEKYNTIHLFPVNYSVATNEDIFKYIKYDVIVELLRNGYEVIEEDVKLSKVFKQFFKKNYEKIAASIIHMIPLLGKEVIDSYDRIRPLIDTFFDIQEKMKLENNEGDRLIKYLENLESSEGNIFEDDIITQIIEAVLDRAKHSDGGDKENILIIDDLDRIDPEHIFRLLNIFAAHFDRSNNSKNKFGFDKVIFVCDINNIREIFRHKYGINVDFTGYINKFYSNTIYNFNHVEYYSTFVLNQLQKITIDDIMGQYNINSFTDNFKSIIKSFLQIFITTRVFDIRNIVKWEKNSNLLYKDHFRLNNTHISFFDKVAIIAIKYISETLGDVNSFYKAISDLKGQEIFTNTNNTFIRNQLCAELVLLINTGIKWHDDGVIRMRVSNRNLDFHYKDTSAGYTLEKIKPVDTGYVEENTTDDDLIELLLKSVKLLHSNNIL